MDEELKLSEKLEAIASDESLAWVMLARDVLLEAIEAVAFSEDVKDAMDAKLVQCAWCGAYTERRDMGAHIATCEHRPEWIMVQSIRELCDLLDKTAGDLMGEYGEWPTVAKILRETADQARIKLVA